MVPLVLAVASLVVLVALAVWEVLVAAPAALVELVVAAVVVEGVVTDGQCQLDIAKNTWIVNR